MRRVAELTRPFYCPPRCELHPLAGPPVATENSLDGSHELDLGEPDQVRLDF